jgi:uncharacterized protein
MSRAGTIDGPQFARDRGVVSGTLEIGALPRLAASGCEAATLRYRVSGGANAQDRPCLEVEASGPVTLVCQRCLGTLEFAVDVRVELELAESEREIAAADDDVDRVLAARSMDVAALVEDEVLLALPMAPMHDRCAPGAGAGETQRAGPFAALAGLRRGGGGDG